MSTLLDFLATVRRVTVRGRPGAVVSVLECQGTDHQSAARHAASEMVIDGHAVEYFFSIAPGPRTSASTKLFRIKISRLIEVGPDLKS